MRSRSRRVLLSFVVLLAVLLLTSAVRERVLRATGRALVVDDPVVRSDVVLVPDWTGASGALEAADLVHQGFASRIGILLDRAGPEEIELVRRGVLKENESWIVRLVRALGVDDVQAIRDAGDGTNAETQLLPAWCERNQVRSVIVVSTPDHSRRLKRLLRRSMAGHGIRAIVKTTRYSEFDPDHWWNTRGGVRVEIQELQKLLLDVVLHPLS